VLIRTPSTTGHPDEPSQEPASSVSCTRVIEQELRIAG
jgi:hypothetical protein